MHRVRNRASTPDDDLGQLADVVVARYRRQPLSAARDWLRGRADTSLGRLALLWFRRYFEASRNSGAAAAGLHHAVGAPRGARHHRDLQPGQGRRERVRGPPDHAHEARRGDREPRPRPVRHHRRTMSLAASVTVVIGFLIWGLSIGQLYQDVYARAWRIHVGTRGRPAALHDLVLRLQRPHRADDRLGVGAPSSRLAGRCFRSGSPARSSSGSGRRASCSIARSRFARSCPGRSWRRSSSAGRSPPRRSGSGRRSTRTQRRSARSASCSPSSPTS